MSNRKKNILKIKWWSLALMLLMIFSTAGMAQETAKNSQYLQKIALCKNIIEKDPLQETNFFSSQDEKVVSWVRFSYDSPENFTLRWEWISPQGKLYHRGEVEMEAGSYNNYRTWYWIKIRDRYASKLPGEWKVKVYINDIFLAERQFFIGGSF
ncbi:MAG TPA: hypothetical protein ENI51_00125 [Candidatus Atribacteria bacterium]|nr:hypothetical protein [Candidatus Atribacteria bacterium]